MCKLHNEVFKAAESRINTECLPLEGGDESEEDKGTRLRVIVCPSQEGMNRCRIWDNPVMCCLPLARGDESTYATSMIDGHVSAPRRRG